MPAQPALVTDEFTLNIVAPRLSGFQPPNEPFDSRGDWELAYGVYTLAGRGARVGSLRIGRTAVGGGDVRLALDYGKLLPGGYRQKVTAVMHCRQDTLSTPTRWSYASEIVDAAGTPLENTTLKKSARAGQREIEITDGPRRRRLSLSPPYALNWALFDAVTRLPHEPIEPLRFTMIDHFDQVKRNQVLSYRKTAEVSLGGRPVRWHAYHHLGEGIVPWVYWVDHGGRLLFVVAGLEAYLFEPAESAA
jgi:hypothetical protein